uniref:Uncharacterized protein n=1 Tax=Rhizophora mucronata TaxID=61149 RepID=A0A2P2PVB8_RHIMU
MYLAVLDLFQAFQKPRRIPLDPLVYQCPKLVPDSLQVGWNQEAKKTEHAYGLSQAFAFGDF